MPPPSDPRAPLSRWHALHSPSCRVLLLILFQIAANVNPFNCFFPIHAAQGSQSHFSIALPCNGTLSPRAFKKYRLRPSFAKQLSITGPATNTSPSTLTSQYLSHLLSDTSFSLCCSEAFLIFILFILFLFVQMMSQLRYCSFPCVFSFFTVLFSFLVFFFSCLLQLLKRPPGSWLLPCWGILKYIKYKKKMQFRQIRRYRNTSLANIHTAKSCVCGHVVLKAVFNLPVV